MIKFENGAFDLVERFLQIGFVVTEIGGHGFFVAPGKQVAVKLFERFDGALRNMVFFALFEQKINCFSADVVLGTNPHESVKNAGRTFSAANRDGGRT